MTTPMTPAPGYDGPDAVPLAAPRAKIRPGRIWYLLPLAALLGGVAWIVFGVTSIGSGINFFARAPLPAGGGVSLKPSGGEVVFLEGAGARAREHATGLRGGGARFARGHCADLEGVV